MSNKKMHWYVHQEGVWCRWEALLILPKYALECSFLTFQFRIFLYFVKFFISAGPSMGPKCGERKQWWNCPRFRAHSTSTITSNKVSGGGFEKIGNLKISSLLVDISVKASARKSIVIQLARAFTICVGNSLPVKSIRIVKVSV